MRTSMNMVRAADADFGSAIRRFESSRPSQCPQGLSLTRPGPLFALGRTWGGRSAAREDQDHERQEEQERGEPARLHGPTLSELALITAARKFKKLFTVSALPGGGDERRLEAVGTMRRHRALAGAVGGWQSSRAPVGPFTGRGCTAPVPTCLVAGRTGAVTHGWAEALSGWSAGGATPRCTVINSFHEVG
jgi:hypothetical protein